MRVIPGFDFVGCGEGSLLFSHMPFLYFQQSFQYKITNSSMLDLSSHPFKQYTSTLNNPHTNHTLLDTLPLPTVQNGTPGIKWYTSPAARFYRLIGLLPLTTYQCFTSELDP